MALLACPLLTSTILLVLSWCCAGGISKELVSHIQCKTCGLAMEVAHSTAKENKIKEEDGLLDMIDALCSVKKPEGKWVAKLDIKRASDGEFYFEPKENIGYCKSECISIQRACQAALKGKEEALVELLMKGQEAAPIQKKLCKKICDKKLPKFDDWKDERFAERDPKEVEAEERVAKMEAETGQKFKMWSREEIASMSEADMELEAAKDALGAQRREVELEKKAEKGEL
mmetsp:Transcript_12579/g.14243  ORF Transcript_12579/g.14243 Transcript_12579/m.14243 type:complete len:230 (+) Transcript_12579:81-770(+)